MDVTQSNKNGVGPVEISQQNNEVSICIVVKQANDSPPAGSVEVSPSPLVLREKCSLPSWLAAVVYTLFIVEFLMRIYQLIERIFHM